MKRNSKVPYFSISFYNINRTQGTLALEGQESWHAKSQDTWESKQHIVQLDENFILKTRTLTTKLLFLH